MPVPSPILDVFPLGFPWKTADPFLFCAYHADAYPPGNETMGPATSLDGRPLGQDFELRDGFRMYHGQAVPGFPQHPHRGFETVTLVRRGTVDHADSLGAAARFGAGDVQWVTAGKGIVHSEMFPLLRGDASNPLELFQIWLNLPSKNKLADPYFTMFWNESIPRHRSLDDARRPTTVTVIAGNLLDSTPPAPPPSSWASEPDAAVAIWTIALSANASWTLPATSSSARRTLYFFSGRQLQVAERALAIGTAVEVRPDADVVLKNGSEAAEVLLLQGKPIGEPVAQYGPFVMTSASELHEAFEEYRRTRFGGWPWPKDDPVHDRAQLRFARYPDGRVERALAPHDGSG